MRITFLSHFPGRGGSTSWLCQLLGVFKESGHETTVLVSHDNPHPQLDEYQVFQATPEAGWRQRLAEYRAFVASTRPDAVYMVSGFEEADLLRFLPYPRFRHIFTFEEHDVLDSPYWLRQLVSFWEVATANTPDVFDLVRPLGPDRYHEVFTPYWVGPPFYNLPELTPRPIENRPLEICCIGRLQKYQKRMHWLPEIVDGCRRAGAQFEWHIYGAGPVEEQLRSELAKRNCSSVVRMHGWVDAEQLAKQASTHDLFFSCSEYEGFPVAVQQAMFCGLMCVAPDLPAGIHYVIERGAVTGYRAKSPWHCVEALLSSTRDRARIPGRKVQTRQIAFDLFGPKIAEQQYRKLDEALRTISFNGRTADLNTAPRIQTLPKWKYLRNRLLRGRSLTDE